MKHVFTCLTTKAIHIKVSHNLTTDFFLCALRKFISKRGRPQHVYSDNRINFVSAARVLRESLAGWNQHQINNLLWQQEISSSFNLPSASHMGGAWERMIRSICQIFVALLQSQTLTDGAFLTLIAKVEGIINS